MIDGTDVLDLVHELYPICRSITGDGVRETLKVLSKYVPVKSYEVPTGTKVFDWQVPEEWNITAAYIECPDGSRIAELSKNNLHVMSYSESVNRKMSLTELKDHIHTLPDHPDWIPYRTMYYDRSWAFCISQNDLDSLPEGDYRAYIDSSHTKGSLTYGEVVIPGTSGKEVIFSSYVCHPSMCNDNLSGVAILTKLAQRLAMEPGLKHTYRFLFVPETIGSITWLAQNEKLLKRIIAGVSVTCAGNRDILTLKKSRQETSLSDKAMRNTLDECVSSYREIDFSPIGSDERQYCSQGINLPMVTLMRSLPSEFDEYHTSADNLDFMCKNSLTETYKVCLSYVKMIEKNNKYVNLFPKCEPQMGKRGIYRKTGGQKINSVAQTAMKWVLNYSDGQYDLFSIADKSHLSVDTLHKAAEILEEQRLIMRISE